MFVIYLRNYGFYFFFIIGISPSSTKTDDNAGLKQIVRFNRERKKCDCESQSKARNDKISRFSDFMYLVINKIKNIIFPKHILKCKKHCYNFIQQPRNFRDQSSNINYCKGFILSIVECDGTLGERCIEFKSFVDGINYETENLISSFLYQVLRFACACLNKRQNGTCYFGVADDGKIIGLNINNLNWKSKFTNALKNENGILKHFHPFVAKRAQECIKNPKFIKVINAEGKNLYVMEVDVEPLSLFCENRYFKLNLTNIRKKPKQNNKNHYSIFIRSGSKTMSIKKCDEEKFIKHELPKLVAYREIFEQNELKTCFNSDAQHGCMYYNSKCPKLYCRGADQSGICISCRHDTFFLKLLTVLAVFIFLHVFYII